MSELTAYMKQSPLVKLRQQSKDTRIKKVLDAVFTYFTLNKKYHDEKSFKTLEKKLINIFSNKTKKNNTGLNIGTWNVKQMLKDYPNLEFKVLISAVHDYLLEYEKYQPKKEVDGLITYLYKLIKERDKKKDSK